MDDNKKDKENYNKALNRMPYKYKIKRKRLKIEDEKYDELEIIIYCSALGVCVR